MLSPLQANKVSRSAAAHSVAQFLQPQLDRSGQLRAVIRNPDPSLGRKSQQPAPIRTAQAHGPDDLALKFLLRMRPGCMSDAARFLVPGAVLRRWGLRSRGGARRCDGINAGTRNQEVHHLFQSLQGAKVLGLDLRRRRQQRAQSRHDFHPLDRVHPQVGIQTHFQV